MSKVGEKGEREMSTCALNKTSSQVVESLINGRNYSKFVLSVGKW